MPAYYLITSQPILYDSNLGVTYMQSYSSAGHITMYIKLISDKQGRKQKNWKGVSKRVKANSRESGGAQPPQDAGGYIPFCTTFVAVY